VRVCVWCLARRVRVLALWKGKETYGVQCFCASCSPHSANARGVAVLVRQANVRAVQLPEVQRLQ
jgi:hypothetical protein